MKADNLPCALYFEY